VVGLILSKNLDLITRRHLPIMRMGVGTGRLIILDRMVDIWDHVKNT
jgi:hypothetical protein